MTLGQFAAELSEPLEPNVVAELRVATLEGRQLEVADLELPLVKAALRIASETCCATSARCTKSRPAPSAASCSGCRSARSSSTVPTGRQTRSCCLT